MDSPTTPLAKRKKTFSMEMPDQRKESYDAFTTETEILLLDANVSPDSKKHLNILKTLCNELSEIKLTDTAARSQKKIDIIRAEAKIEQKLQSDAALKKYKQVIIEGRSTELMLRFGDYFCQNLHEIQHLYWVDLREKVRKVKEENKKHPEAKKDLPVDLWLGGIRWGAIVKEMEKEANLPDESQRSWANMLKEFAPKAGLTFEEACFQARLYADRNEIAHGGINDDVERLDFHRMAERLYYDRLFLCDYEIDGKLKEVQPNLLAALDSFQKRFFTKIIALSTSEGGLLVHSDPTEYSIKRRDEREKKDQQFNATKAKNGATNLAIERAHQLNKRIQEDPANEPTEIRTATETFLAVHENWHELVKAERQATAARTKARHELDAAAKIFNPVFEKIKGPDGDAMDLS